MIHIQWWYSTQTQNDFISQQDKLNDVLDQCSKLLPFRLPEADNFGGGPVTFWKVFFNFMFMIWDSRQKDWQLFDWVLNTDCIHNCWKLFPSYLYILYQYPFMFLTLLFKPVFPLKMASDIYDFISDDWLWSKKLRAMNLMLGQWANTSPLGASKLWFEWAGWAGVILCMCPANERWRYIVTSSLIGSAHT